MADATELPPLELPDDEIRRVMAILGPILAQAVEEMFARGYPGWGNYLAVIYDSMDGVLAPAEGAATVDKQS